MSIVWKLLQCHWWGCSGGRIQNRETRQESSQSWNWEKETRRVCKDESAPRTVAGLPPRSCTSPCLVFKWGQILQTAGLLLLTRLSDPWLTLCSSLGISWGHEQLALPWHIYRLNLLLLELRPPTWRASGLLGPPPSRVGDLLIWWRSRCATLALSRIFAVTGGLESLDRKLCPFPHIQETLAAG